MSKSFRNTVMSSTSVKEIYIKGIDSAENINCNIDELGSNLNFTLYCNSDELCEKLGIMTIDDLKEDVKRISSDTDVDFDEINDHIHKYGEYGVNGDLYTSEPSFMIINLNDVEEFFK